MLDGATVVNDPVLVEKFTGDDKMCCQWNVLNPTVHASFDNDLKVNDFLGRGVVERPALISDFNEHIMARQIDWRIASIDQLLP